MPTGQSTSLRVSVLRRSVLLLSARDVSFLRGSSKQAFRRLLAKGSEVLSVISNLVLVDIDAHSGLHFYNATRIQAAASHLKN